MRSGQRQIWWRDLATALKEMPVDGTQEGSQQAPSLFGTRVGFQNNSTGPWNVYAGSHFFFTGSG